MSSTNGNTKERNCSKDVSQQSSDIPSNVENSSYNERLSQYGFWKHEPFNELNRYDLDDNDAFSQMSDSDFSDVSHNTHSSPHNMHLSTCKMFPYKDDISQTRKVINLKRNFSSGDLKEAHVNMQLTGEVGHFPLKQNRLSKSSIWNWIKTHEIGEDLATGGTTQKQQQTLLKGSVTGREINILGPSQW